MKEVYFFEYHLVKSSGCMSQTLYMKHMLSAHALRVHDFLQFDDQQWEYWMNT